MTSPDMPTMPPPPRPALVLNLSLPMAKGGKIIPQPLWMESQLKDYAQQYAQQFERAAVSLALDRADLTAQVEQTRTPVAWRYWKDKFGCWEYSDVPLEFPAVPAGTKMEPLYLGPNVADKRGGAVLRADSA